MRPLGMLVLAWMLATPGMDKADGPKSVGSFVIVKEGAPLRSGWLMARIEGWTFKGKVDQVVGDWLHLAGIDSGWVRADEVMTLSESIEELSRKIAANPLNADLLMKRADMHSMNLEADRAIADYTEVIRLNPKRADAHVSRGRQWELRGECDRMIADLTEAIRLDPDNLWAYCSRGDGWEMKEEFDRAIADYSEAIKLDPNDPGGFMLRGFIWLLNKKDDEKALADYNEVIRLDPNHASSYVSRAAVWSSRKDFPRVIADYSEAIRLEPDPEFYYVRGWAHGKLEDFAGAIADLDDAIRLGLKTSEVFEERADAWAHQGRFENALADYAEAILLNPKASGAFGGRGQIRFQMHDFAGTLADCEEAIRLDPKEAWPFALRAWLRSTCTAPAFRDGKLALDDANRACGLGGLNHAFAVDALAAAYAEIGDFDKAVETERQAIDLAQTETLAQGMKDRLALYKQKKPFRALQGHMVRRRPEPL